jgi:hypothetical protein
VATYLNDDIADSGCAPRDDLKDPERRDYIRAVKCLAAKPTTVDKSVAPGAVNRLDDFVFIHINQTNVVHNSVSLPWPGCLLMYLLPPIIEHDRR